MRKFIILVLLILVNCGLYAQSKYKVSGKVGLNLSGTYGEAAKGNKAQIGYQFGLVGEYRATKFLGIAPEIIFSTQGASLGDVDEDYTQRLNMNFINVPIMAKFYVCGPLSIDFGPEFGFCVFNHLMGVEAYSEYFHNFNFGLGLGATYKIGKVSVNARFNLGLTNIYHEDAINKDHLDSDNVYENFGNMKHYNAQIGLTYDF